MNHDYYTLQPTYVNHPAQDSSYAVLNDPVYATNLASEEYADVPDLVATATTSSHLDESLAYETPIPLGDHYECVSGHTPNSSYVFVPTMVSACKTVQQCTVYVRTYVVECYEQSKRCSLEQLCYNCFWLVFAALMGLI